MLYSGLALFVGAVAMMGLELAGVTPGAGGFANLTLVLAFALLGAGAVQIGHHYRNRLPH